MNESNRPHQPATAQVPVWFFFVMIGMSLLVATGFLWLGRSSAPGANLPTEELKILSRAYDRIDEHYIYDLTPERRAELLQAAVSGMVEKLDRYSRYFPPNHSQAYDIGTRGVMTGVGVVVHTDRKRVIVLYPSPGGPAEQAGLRVGDIVQAVDGTPVESATQAVKVIRGEKETTTKLTILRGDGAPFEVAVKRDGVIIPSIKWARILDAENGIGYVYLQKFAENSAKELDITLEHLDGALGARLRGLVLDLRQNPGGLLTTCLEITNRFLMQGTIVTLRSRTADDIVHAADPAKCSRPGLALVLLLDGGSASASEVLAGALQDHGRARVVGTRSYGKGVVQSVFSWSDTEGRVQITTSYYLTPKGRILESHLPEHADDVGGIAPDREVKFEKRVTRETAAFRLERREVPRKYRAEVDALCERNERIKVYRPLGVDEDVQLAAALEEVRAILGADRDPAPVPLGAEKGAKARGK